MRIIPITNDGIHIIVRITCLASPSFVNVKSIIPVDSFSVVGKNKKKLGNNIINDKMTVTIPIKKRRVVFLTNCNQHCILER